MLQHGAVAGSHRGSEETEELPERIIPGHHREDDTERVEDHTTFRGIARHDFIAQKAWGVLGVEVARPGALLDFSFGLDDGLAHLLSDQPGEVFLVRTQRRCDPTQRGRAHSQFLAAPFLLRGESLVESLVNLCRRMRLVACEFKTVGGVDRHKHGRTFLVGC